MHVALVLGSANRPDGPSPNLLRRARHGAQLWHEGRVQALVGTGGVGGGTESEAEAIARVLMAEGVPDSAIRQEREARDTLENIRLSLPLLRELGATEVLIVSDAVHCPRAVMTARAHGLSARAAPVPFRGSHLRSQSWLALRECAAIPLYWWRLHR
ncbi:YdcF family protein [Pseudoroseicyclus tamaricis]|uniref:YdcF family protein n=1 Tax=Pseudoroseicyclus tamaricis TaxID=2705421 RepID=A0A6B2JTD2_9RHOB|nr:YdcF family protein [Pseudoroseicyclus tamaricis]NDV01817.1 YdcF family protein [Pseudoroseicyclus tamaricis]